MDDVDPPAPVDRQDRPDSARQDGGATGRAADRAETERPDPRPGDPVRGTCRRVAQRDDVAVVDGGQALDEVDDGRHARLVPLDDETRNDDRDVQAPRGHAVGDARGREPQPPRDADARASLRPRLASVLRIDWAIVNVLT